MTETTGNGLLRSFFIGSLLDMMQPKRMLNAGLEYTYHVLTRDNKRQGKRQAVGGILPIVCDYR